MTMFVRLVKKPNDRVSVRIVESSRVDGKVKQKIICGIGTAHKDDVGKINKLKSVGESVIISLKNEDNPALPGFEELAHGKKKSVSTSKQEEKSPQVSIGNLKEEVRFHKGIDDIYGAMFEQLSLLDSIESGYKTKESNQLFKEVVLSRIANPVSKRKSVKFIEIDKSISLDLDKVYRMMDKVYKSEERIKKKIINATTELFNHSVDVAFFDVTTLYFESFTPDDLRRSGFSKDGKFKETQVMLALVTTTDGLPLGYELFPGNSYEGNTLIPVMEKIQQRYNLSKTDLVADRAMFTKENLNKLDNCCIKFIVAAKLKTLKKALKAEIVSDLEEAKSLSKELETWTKDYELEGRRLIVNYSGKRESKDKKDRERLVERIQKKMKNGKVVIADLINNSGTKKYLSIDKKGAKEATLNEDKIRAEQKWDGLHAVITNHDIKEASSSQILERYRGLWQIEEAFRVNKNDLKMRPIYHWTENRIKAHILICFVAFTLVAFVRKHLRKEGLTISFEEAREELTRLQASLITDQKSGQKFILPSRTTPIQRAIYSAFRMKIQEAPTILH